jgi:4-hydroxybenzoate polyprenyltransferase
VWKILNIPAVLKLTRWSEFIPWALPLTLLGALMAYRFGESIALDRRFWLVLLANILAVAYAFMVNDIEDADDDRRNPHRAPFNAITAGELSVRGAWIAAFGVAIIGLGSFALLGLDVFLAGALTIVLGHLYSWRKIRLKALPLVDILSHVLMLSALLMVAPYLVYDNQPTIEVWLLIISVTLFSAYGQLHNQWRDFEADRTAKLKNTASIIGKQATQWTGYASVVVAVICLAITIFQGAFPLELIGVVIAAIPIAWLFGRGRDMRGDKSDAKLDQGQVQFLIVVNVVLLAWFFYAWLNP